MVLVPREQIRASFSKAATSYVEQASHQHAMAALLLNIVKAQLFSNLNADDLVLDLGSGTGFVSHEAQQQLQLEQIVRLDLSENMLRNDPAFKSENDFICGDLQELPIKSSSIDLCLSSYAFQWASSPEILLKELFRVLKPGASVFFALPGENTFEELKAAWAEVDDHRHVHDFWHQQAILDVAHETGFECLHFSQQMNVLGFDKVKSAMNHIKKIGAHNLDEQRQKNLLGKEHYFAYSQAFKRYSKISSAYSLSYQSYFFGFKKP